MVPAFYGRCRKFSGPSTPCCYTNVAQESACPKPENMLPKDFEQPGGDPKRKPRSNPRSNKGTPRNARNRKMVSGKRMKAARYTCPLPEPPPFGLSHRRDGKEAVNIYTLGKNELKQGEMAFLEELDLNVIL